MKPIILLMGAPGSGKGTQATLLKKLYPEQLYLSTGDLLRSAISQKTVIGQKAKSFIDQGLLVPTELVQELLYSAISEGKEDDVIILDGYPRTLEQAEDLWSRFAKKRKIIALFINVPFSKLKERLLGRSYCPSCGRTYNRNLPPKLEGFCDNCGSSLAVREDDREEVITHRLEVYLSQTAPILDRLEEKGVLVKVDGDQTSALVHEAITECLLHG